MPRMTRRVLVLLSAAALSGCSSAAPTPETPLPAAPHHPFCTEAAPAWCAWRAACEPRMLSAPVADCAEAERARCDQGMARLGPEFDAGRLTWDAAAAERCLAGLQALRCDAPGTSCAGLLAAAAAPGAACTHPGVPGDLLPLVAYQVDECTGPGTCPYACGATCPLPVPLGGSCEVSGSYCVEGASCVAGSGTARTCLADGGAGSACGGAGQYCRADHWCATAGGVPCPYGTSGCTCRPDLAPGDPCTDSNQCPEPLRCADGTCRARQGAEGQSCFTLDRPPCQGELCCLVAAAGDLFGTCGPRRAAGEPCLGRGECADGLACRGDGRCGAPAGAGGACVVVTSYQDSAAECAAGLACVAGSCQPKGATLGAPCAGTGCFGAALLCSYRDVCDPVVGLNASCAMPATCAGPGLYCGADLRCHRGVTGAPCTLWWDCESRDCVAGRCAAPCPVP